MNRYVLVPHQGAGRARLVRQGRTVLFTTGDGPGAAALTGWCRLFGDRPTAEILTELARVTADNPALGAFALAVLDDDAVELAVSGPLPVSLHAPAGVDVMAPGDGLTRRRVDDASVIALTVPGAVVDPLLELERGTIAADGFEIRVTQPSRSAGPWAPPVPSAAPEAPAVAVEETGATPRPAVVLGDALPAAAEPVVVPEPAPVAAPAPAPAAAPAPAVVSLHTDAGGDLPPMQPLPVAGQPPAATPAPVAAEPPADDRVMVQGLHCARGHFNDPRARFCGVCGIAMHQASFVLTSDVRPPLGVLVFGDGSYQTLARTAVVGRDPGEDVAVTSGHAVALPLADPTNTLSRVHAELRLTDWDVQLVDRGSTNGTFVWAPGQTAWERLAANSPRTLQPGTHVSFGRLTATFESSQRAS